MRARYAAAIRAGVVAAQHDAHTLACLSPVYAAAVERVEVHNHASLPLVMRLKLYAYQRTFTRAANDAAITLSVDHLMEEIETEL